MCEGQVVDETWMLLQNDRRVKRVQGTATVGVERPILPCQRLACAALLFFSERHPDPALKTNHVGSSTFGLANACACLSSGEIFAFTPTGPVLKDGRLLEVDVVLYCTGFERSYNFFVSEAPYDSCLEFSPLLCFLNLDAQVLTLSSHSSCCCNQCQ